MKQRFSYACACACASAPLLACAPPPFEGVDIASAQETRVEPRSDHSFDLTGTYQSPQSGTLVLRQRGEHLDGSYQLMTSEYQINGFLSGTVHGNLAQVKWSETQRLSGKSKQYSSQGYFYSVLDRSLGPELRLVGQQEYSSFEPGRRGGSVATKHSNVWVATRASTQHPSDH